MLHTDHRWSLRSWHRGKPCRKKIWLATRARIRIARGNSHRVQRCPEAMNGIHPAASSTPTAVIQGEAGISVFPPASAAPTHQAAVITSTTAILRLLNTRPPQPLWPTCSQVNVFRPNRRGWAGFEIDTSPQSGEKHDGVTYLNGSTSGTTLLCGSRNMVTNPTEQPTELVASEAGLSVVIPAYNEEPGIADVLRELFTTLNELEDSIPFEVIVVDDGSKDATVAAVEPFTNERTILLQHEINRGYGAAIKTGLALAQYPWILITDADGTYPNEALATLLERRATADMVVGSRTARHVHVPLLRRPARWVLRKLAEYLSRAKIPDLNSGFRVIRRDLFENYRPLLPDGFSLTTTITLAMLSASHRVSYVPIDYRHRKGASKIRPIADTMNFVVLIFRTVTYFEPLRVFVPVALFFLFASIAVGFGSYFWLGQLMDVTTVVLFVTSIHLLAVGMLADVMSRRLR